MTGNKSKASWQQMVEMSGIGKGKGKEERKELGLQSRTNEAVN